MARPATRYAFAVSVGLLASTLSSVASLVPMPPLVGLLIFLVTTVVAATAL